MHGILLPILFILVVGVNYQKVASGIINGGDLPEGENNIDPVDAGTFYLTAWELSVLSELYIELSILRCPAIQKSTARSLKKFIVKRMSLVERSSEVMGAQFFVVYQKLVGCLTALEDKKATTKSSPDYFQARKIIEEEEKEEENLTVDFEDTLQEDENYDDDDDEHGASDLTTTNTTNSLSTATIVEPLKHHSIFTAAVAWLSKLFDPELLSTTIVDVKASTAEPDKRRQQIERAKKEKAENIKTDLARRDFHTMIEMFTRVVINSCPIKFQPNPQFTAESIEEIVAAITFDPTAMTKAVDFYFRKHGMWRQVQRCVDQTINSSPAAEPYNWLTRV